MSIDPTNPYTSPPASGGIQPPTRPITGMDYMRMITYVFDNPNWFMNVLLGALCMLIPVIGKIIVSGYEFEATIMLIAEGGSRYPDFDFNRFGDYLMRGLWPFLVGLALSVVLMIAIGILFGAAAIFGSIAGESAGQAVFGLLIFALVIISPVIALVVQPMLLRAALTLDFMQAFEFEWVKDFLTKVWVELLLGLLFWIVAANILAMIGALACCVGLFFVGPIMMLAQGHLLFQVYSIYLNRGGTPIPIKISAQPITHTMP